MNRSKHVIDNELVPSWVEKLKDEDSHDRNLMIKWAFVQHRDVLDHSKKDLVCNMTSKMDHVCDQSNRRKNNNDNLWRILLDSQHACSIIINDNLLTNIRKCKWKLRLKTQEGEFCIDQIDQMKGVVQFGIIQREFQA